MAEADNEADIVEEALRRLRGICGRLPESSEGTTVHHPSFKVRKKTYVIYAEPVRDDAYPSVWIKSTHGDQQELVHSDPDRFFVPPYLGPKGWVAARLDDTCDWQEVTELITDAWRLVAPRRAVAQLDAQ